MESVWRVWLVVFFVWFPAPSDSPPVTAVVSVSEGEDCELPCFGLSDPSGPELLHLTWDHEDRVLLRFRGGMLIDSFEPPDVTERVQLKDPQLSRGDLSVVLKKAMLENSGTYKCNAQYENNNEKIQELSQVVRLKVTARVPSVTSWTGQDQELLCLMKESAEAEVLLLEWTKEGLNVLLYRDERQHQGLGFKDRVELQDPQPRFGDMSMTLKNVSTQDSGVYKCEAVILTSDGKQKVYSKSMRLKVRPEELIVAQSGEDRALHCASPQGGAEVLSLRWSREGSAPRPTSGNMSLLLRNISSEDSGLYRCLAVVTTPQGRQELSRSLHLTVAPVKHIVARSGNDTVLPCASPQGGAAVLDVRWRREGSEGYVLWYRGGLRDDKQNQTFKNRVELRSGDMSVLLKNISAEDSGVYQCQARTEASGRQEEHIQVIRLTLRPEAEMSDGGSHRNQFESILVSMLLIVGFVVIVVVLIITVCMKHYE